MVWWWSWTVWSTWWSRRWSMSAASCALSDIDFYRLWWHSRISLLKVRQKLYLVVKVVEKHAGTQLIPSDRLVGDLVAFSVFLEEDHLIWFIDCHLDDVTLHEFEWFHAVVVLALVVTPTAAISANHIGTMTDLSEIEAILKLISSWHGTFKNCSLCSALTCQILKRKGKRVFKNWFCLRFAR